MEEKKMLVNEEMDNVNSIHPSQNSGNNIVTILLILLVIVMAGVLIYVLVLKPKDKDTNNNGTTQPTTTVLTNSEALSIVKEKVEEANNFFGSFESSNECTNNVSEGYCYYTTLDSFKNQFYRIYSTNLTYNDVFNDNQGFAPYIKTNNSKVYVLNHCTEGSGDKSLKGDYEVKSVTSDTIIAKYVILDTDSVTGNTSNQDVEVKLVKEDNTWKIMKATLVGRCNGIYEVGK